MISSNENTSVEHLRLADRRAINNFLMAVNKFKIDFEPRYC